MTTPTRCLAARLHAYGGPVAIDDVPVPVPGPGEVLVRVHAAGVNPIDWKIRDGLRRERMPLTLPAVIGCDIAGSVAAVGPGVPDVQPGQRVFGMVGLHGGFQGHVAVPAERLAPTPDALSDEEAASLPLAALTAWQALMLATPSPGERVLVHAAAGGVGGFAVQLAKSLGLHVVATASAPKHGHVARLGADQVIDYRAAPFESLCSAVDIVLDLIGGDTQARSWALLRPGGRLVSTIAVPEPGEAGRPAHAFAARVGVRPDGQQLRHFCGLVAAGRLHTQVQHHWPFTDVQAALEHNKAGGATGKSVLRFDAAS